MLESSSLSDQSNFGVVYCRIKPVTNTAMVDSSVGIPQDLCKKLVYTALLGGCVATCLEVQEQQPRCGQYPTCDRTESYTMSNISK